jgi:hypothetical protein
MILSDQKIKEECNKLNEILTPKALEKIKSHLVSIAVQIEDLRKSRDRWKERYDKLKYEKM